MRAPRPETRRPSALVFDLDGTLVGGAESVSPRVAAAVRAAAARIPVAIASGRASGDVGRFARQLGLTAPQITDNGARLYDPVRAETLEECLMPVHAARWIVNALEARGIPYYVVDAGRVATEPAAITEWRVTLVAACTGDPAVTEELRVSAAGLGGVTITPCTDADRARWYVNFTRLGADKGGGVRRFARLAGVDLARAVAVGDSYNDLEMFAAVGVAVAMGGAAEKVRAAAQHVVASVDEDGLAEAVERFVLPFCAA